MYVNMCIYIKVYIGIYEGIYIYIFIYIYYYYNSAGKGVYRVFYSRVCIGEGCVVVLIMV